jgi:hypothetical protein
MLEEGKQIEVEVVDRVRLYARTSCSLTEDRDGEGKTLQDFPSLHKLEQTPGNELFGAADQPAMTKEDRGGGSRLGSGAM